MNGKEGLSATAGPGHWPQVVHKSSSYQTMRILSSTRENAVDVSTIC